MENFTVLCTSLIRFIFGTDSMHTSPHAYRIFVFRARFFLLIHAVWVLGQRPPWGLSITCRLLWPVWVQLRRTHAEVIQLSVALSGVLAQLWEIRFSTIPVGLTCLHAFQKSGFSQTNTINRFSLTSCKHTDWESRWASRLRHLQRPGKYKCNDCFQQQTQVFSLDYQKGTHAEILRINRETHGEIQGGWPLKLQDTESTRGESSKKFDENCFEILTRVKLRWWYFDPVVLLMPLKRTRAPLNPKMDCDFKQEKQMNSAVKLGFFQLSLLTKVKPFYPPLISRGLHAFITIRPDYCKALYVGIHLASFSRLQLVQNAAARLLTGSRNETTSPLFLPPCSS